MDTKTFKKIAGLQNKKKRESPPPFTAKHKEHISNTHKKIGVGKWMLGRKASIETKLKLKKNNAKYWLGKKRPSPSIKTRKKLSLAQKRIVKLGIHHLWKGGVTKKNILIRTSLEYKLWREAVFSRDNWTCIWCAQRGEKLHADHIKPFALYPELRFSIDNGRTLCIPCHKTTNTYLNPHLNKQK